MEGRAVDMEAPWRLGSDDGAASATGSKTQTWAHAHRPPVGGPPGTALP